jgi:hypothetical protein
MMHLDCRSKIIGGWASFSLAISEHSGEMVSVNPYFNFS